jgi:hypothetical protein
MIAMMRSMSYIMSIVHILGLLYFDFFRDVGFIGETFLLLDVSTSSMGFLGSVTFPYFFLSSSLSSSYFSTLSPPPPSCESEVMSSNMLFISYISSVFFFLLLLGASNSSRVTIILPMRLGSNSYSWSNDTRNYSGHSLVISLRFSSMRL